MSFTKSTTARTMLQSLYDGKTNIPLRYIRDVEYFSIDRTLFAIVFLEVVQQSFLEKTVM